jgi:hypothetical protein
MSAEVDSMLACFKERPTCPCAAPRTDPVSSIGRQARVRHRGGFTPIVFLNQDLTDSFDSCAFCNWTARFLRAVENGLAPGTQKSEDMRVASCLQLLLICRSRAIQGRDIAVERL